MTIIQSSNNNNNEKKEERPVVERCELRGLLSVFRLRQPLAYLSFHHQIAVVGWQRRAESSQPEKTKGGTPQWDLAQ
jgi:hypothetical protein